jgi:enamine deaminase RidA (YjgF/YER057c/UK114 family)
VSSPFLGVNPRELGAHSGFSHGLLAPAGGRLLFIAGQTATDEAGRIASDRFTEQFDRSLARVLTVVREAGGQPQNIARMTMYVASMDRYCESRAALRDIWRRHMGLHYPAMVLVEVSALFDTDAVVEIEAMAVLP